MNRTVEKIPASQYAARYGWQEDAVIHRIRSGIYDGVEEDGTWYILLNYSTDIEPPSRHDAQSHRLLPLRYKPGSEYTSPVLPWRTIDGPLKWPARLRKIARFMAMSPLALALLIQLSPDMVTWLLPLASTANFVVGLSLFLIAYSTSSIYEGIRTGRMPDYFFDHGTAYSNHPLSYTLIGLSYAFSTFTGLLGLSIVVFGWPNVL
ncbi:MAG: hypothetical protein RhofKO_03940 [Rhodothermales bacterium]